jgi:nucleoside-diphosphate-sugar epimerase
MKKNCAITGSNGYVGGLIKNYFSAKEWEVLELTRQPRPNTRAVKFHLGEDILPSVLAGVKALVHCAYDFKPLTKGEIWAVNVAGAEKLFKTALEAGVEKIICLSTISAFPGCDSLYGKAKLDIEKIALHYGAQVVRPGLVYSDNPGGMFGKLTDQVRNASLIPLIGDGSQVQFLVHYEDLCTIAESFASGSVKISAKVITAANSAPWLFKDLLLEIARRFDKNIKFVPMPWRLVWMGLKAAELCGLRLNFRSDSLVSLMHQNQAPDFSTSIDYGLVCRPLEIDKLRI